MTSLFLHFIYAFHWIESHGTQAVFKLTMQQRIAYLPASNSQALGLKTGELFLDYVILRLNTVPHGS